MFQIKLYYFILLLSINLIFSLSISAQSLSITVVNNGTTSLFTRLDSAIAQAQSGDTVLLPGGDIGLPAGSLVINKELHILGEGYRADSSQATDATRLIGDITVDSAGDNGSLEGVYISRDLNILGNSNNTIQNFTASRCFIGRWLNINSFALNNLIKECVVQGTYGTVISAVNGGDSQLNQFFNNVFFSDVKNFSSGNQFEQNVFHRKISYINSSTLKNNIFTSPSAIFLVESCNFYNNILAGSVPGGTNGGSGNISGISANSVFLDVSAGNPLSNNYHLLQNSPAISAGLNGEDCGLYGGIYSVKENAHPPHPRIISVDISTSTDANGNLPIQITVQAQKN